MDVRFLEHSSWKGGPRFWSRGRAFREGTLLDAQALAPLFDHARDSETVAAFAKGLNGHFAIIGQNQHGQFAVVDRARSYPVFFAQQGDGIAFAESAMLLAPAGPASPPPRGALVDFAYSGYVTGDMTLVPGVRQIEAASVVWSPESGDSRPIAEVTTYDSFVPTVRGSGVRESALLDELHASMVASVSRLIEVAAGRTIVVPLSGGYDSRLIVMLLKLAQYDNVVCFSYGRPGNDESALSKVVAEELGYRWLFVPYDEAKWANWVRSPAWQGYADMAHLGVALPLVQGWPCVGSLLREGLVPRDSVFAPGYFGGGLFAGYFSRPDLLGGGEVSLDVVAEKLVSRMFWACGDPHKRELELAGASARIAAQLIPPDGEVWEAEAAAYESWIYRNYEVKFMGNAARYYDYWDADWWFPFADKDVFAYWQSVPYAKRLYNALNIKYVTEYASQLLGIPPTSAIRQIKKGHTRPWGPRARARALADRVDTTGVLKMLKNRSRGVPAPPDLDRVYNGHPLAWWSVVDRDIFDRQYTGKESIYPFMARQMLQQRYGWSFEADPDDSKP